MENARQTTLQHVLLVTGPSGAGRSTAISALEDLGYEAIDNLPLSLFPEVLNSTMAHPLAIGLDVRNRDFTVDGVLDCFREIAADTRLDADLVYLDCTPEVLTRRFSETRRRHPLAPDDAPEFGIAQEIELLSPVRHRASLIIDTSDLSPHDLRDAIRSWYSPKSGAGMAISVQSFSYKRGAPQGVDMVFDCRFLSNPHWEPALRPLDGRDPEVEAYVQADPRMEAFSSHVSSLLDLLLPAFEEEGKSHLVIGFGCTGGQHRSVVMAEQVAKRLANQGWRASKRHRELERRSRPAQPQVGEQT